jgi:hypothetical protein
MKQEAERETEYQPKLDDAIHRAEEERSRQDQHREEPGGQPAVDGAADVFGGH